MIGAERTEAAHAKVNLGLAVIARRGDGYHEVETLMARIALADTVRVRLVGEPSVAAIMTYQDGARDASLPGGRDNLAVRAAEAYLEARCVADPQAPALGARIYLDKRIPVAAGLGGGSSNAAAVLRALAALAPAGVEVEALARALGSDVPFFLADVPLALARGRGERLMPMDLPAIASTPLVLANPGFGVSAGEAYAALVGFTPRLRADRLLERLETGEEPGWSNALQPGVLRVQPKIREVLAALKDAGLRGALMSGSGPTCFAVARSDAHAVDAARALAEAHEDWWTTTTVLS